jgi:hypothetical protein
VYIYLYVCSLLGYYAALSGCSVLTFRENLSVPSSRVKTRRYRTITILCVTSQKSADLIYIAAEAWSNWYNYVILYLYFYNDMLFMLRVLVRWQFYYEKSRLQKSVELPEQDGCNGTFPWRLNVTPIYSVSTKSLRGFEKIWRANKLSYPYVVCDRLQWNSGSFF